LFLYVTVCVAVSPAITVPKSMDVGASVSDCALPVPVHVKAMDCWAIGEGKLAPRFEVSDPDAVGVQLTEMAQLAPAARLDPQVLVSVNELAFVPKNPKLVIVNAAVPAFLSVAARFPLASIFIGRSARKIFPHCDPSRLKKRGKLIQPRPARPSSSQVGIFRLASPRSVHRTLESSEGEILRRIFILKQA
jgi:hypothetical protein